MCVSLHVQLLSHRKQKAVVEEEEEEEEEEEDELSRPHAVTSFSEIVNPACWTQTLPSVPLQYPTSPGKPWCPSKPHIHYHCVSFSA